MTIGALSLGEHAVAAQISCVQQPAGKTPPKRVDVAKADSTAQPEPR